MLWKIEALKCHIQLSFTASALLCIADDSSIGSTCSDVTQTQMSEIESELCVHGIIGVTGTARKNNQDLQSWVLSAWCWLKYLLLPPSYCTMKASIQFSSKVRKKLRFCKLHYVPDTQYFKNTQVPSPQVMLSFPKSNLIKFIECFRPAHAKLLALFNIL